MTRRIGARLMTRRTGTARAFTLIELLLVLGIIALLIAMVFVAYKGVRGSASQAVSVNALRQMGTGYQAYSGDNRQYLMPGYINKGKVDQLSIKSRVEGGEYLTACTGTDPTDCCDNSSYVWRLTPYLSDAWVTVMGDYQNQSLVGTFREEFLSDPANPGSDPPRYGCGSGVAGDLGIAERPSFGLNSIFVGGDTTHGTTPVRDRNPWDNPSGKIAVTRVSEVLHPTKLILFGPTGKAANTGPMTNVYDTERQLGFPELRAPFIERSDWSDPDSKWVSQQWTIGSGRLVERTPGGEYANGAGLPITRWGENQYPVVNFDGSAGVENLVELSGDLQRWISLELNPEIQ